MNTPNLNITKIIHWTEERLLSNGITIKNPPEHILATPWSNVLRFSTSNGYIYLKQTGSALFLEPAIMQILYNKFQANVPIVVDINKDLNCFFMKDYGNPLRESLKRNFQPDLLCQGIKKYTHIQRDVENHIKTFIELGVPDWRLEKLPILYKQLISKEALLIEDGMMATELNTLHELYSKFASLCELLSSYKIPETLDHGNFNDNNILIENNTNNMTIIDWGEAVITHPFFSLAYCLRNAASHHSLKETDKAYLELQNACLESWQEIEQKNNLLAAILLAKQLLPVYLALGGYRLRTSSDAEIFETYSEGKGWLCRCFREFIKETLTV